MKSYANLEAALLLCKTLSTSSFKAQTRILILCRGSLPIFHPEFGRFMLEATPGQPWGIGLKDLLSVEADMKLR